MATFALESNRVLSFTDIKQLYPDEWVLIGNPELRNPEINEAIVHKIVPSVVLLHSKDKREIGYKAKDVKHGFERFACVFTGEPPRNRRLNILPKLKYFYKTLSPDSLQNQKTLYISDFI